MFCREFCHVGIRDTGEGVIRNAIAWNLVHPKPNAIFKNVKKGQPRIMVIKDQAHLSFAQAPAGCGPPFTFVRNPYDWYISAWMHDLKTKRVACSFALWFWSGNNPGLYNQYRMLTQDKIPIHRVGLFENMADDFARILPEIWTGVTSDEVASWFPDAYKQWGGRAWIENIEQHMRHDIYSLHTSILVEIEKNDEFIFTTFGYDSI